MEVHFPPEVEAMLTHTAARQGRHPDETVKRGEDTLRRGEYLTHEEMGQRLTGC